MEEFRLHVFLTPSDEVNQLRNQISELNSKLLEMKRKFDSLEYSYRCESLVNMELVDLCWEHGIRYRPHLDRHGPSPVGDSG